jgi:hypothetical protein
MKYFVILLILIGFSGSFLFNHVYGLWVPLSPEDLIEQSKTIFVGTVTAVNPVDVEYQSSIARDGTKKDSVGPEIMTLEEYTIDVEEFLKNPQDSDIMKVLRATVSGVPSGPAKISGFEIGDRVLFYLPNDEQQTHFPGQYLPESFKIPNQCDAKNVLEKPRIEGRNQFSIIQEDVQREDNFTANIPIRYSYDRDGGTLSGQSFNVSIGINKVTNNSIKNIFQKRIQVNYEPCEWIGSAKWDFVPQPGKYSMTVHISEGSGGSGFSRSFSVLETTETPSTPNKEVKTSLKLDDLASELWYDHDYIIDGTILDIRGYDKPERTYDIQINSFFKPTEGSGPKVITVFGSPNFYNVKGDRGIFFIKKDDARWIFGEYGAKDTENCTPELMYHYPRLIDPPLTRGLHPPDYSYKLDCYPHYYQKYLPQYMKAHGATEFPSPLSQQTVQVPANEVVCNEDLELVMKNNGRAACVKPETKTKLIERGWAIGDASKFQEMLEYLRSGPQNVGTEYAELIKGLAVLDPTVNEFLEGRTWEYACCGYLLNEEKRPGQYKLVINFFDYDDEKQLAVIFDLETLQVVRTQISDVVRLQPFVGEN